MSLATAGIYCTICPPLSGAMEECFIVRVHQLQMLYRCRCCISASHAFHLFSLLCLQDAVFIVYALKVLNKKLLFGGWNNAE